MRLGDIKDIQVEDYEQETEWSCGPAALKIVLDSIGHPVSEDQLIQLTGASPIAGTRHEGMISAASALGHKVFATEECSDEDLSRFLASKIPVIVDYQGSRGGHYVVITGLEDGRVHIQDPRKHGPRHHTLDLNMFKARWHATTYGDRDFSNKWMMAVLS